MEWREILYKIISLLWEHNEFTYYFNSMDDITLVFCTTHATIHFSQKRQASAANGSPDLHTYWRFYSSLNTLAWYSSFFLRQTRQWCRLLLCIIQTYVNALCSHRRDISLCMTLRHALSRKRLEHFLKVKKYLF